MIHSSWVNDQVYDQYISTLENMNLRDFCANFCVAQQGQLHNKICRDKKPNYVAIFYPNKSSYPRSDEYSEYCMLELLKFKPWVGDKESVNRGRENSKENIIKL